MHIRSHLPVVSTMLSLCPSSPFTSLPEAFEVSKEDGTLLFSRLVRYTSDTHTRAFDGVHGCLVPHTHASLPPSSYTQASGSLPDMPSLVAKIRADMEESYYLDDAASPSPIPIHIRQVVVPPPTPEAVAAALAEADACAKRTRQKRILIAAITLLAIAASGAWMWRRRKAQRITELKLPTTIAELI